MIENIEQILFSQQVRALSSGRVERGPRGAKFIFASIYDGEFLNGSWAPISGVLETPKRNRRKFVHEFTKFWLNLYVRVNLLVLVNYCSS